jgi:UDP-N-acetylmuramate--alanine ligase
MSGIAEVLLNLGYAVQGSDLKGSDHRAAVGLGARSSSASGPRTWARPGVVSPPRSSRQPRTGRGARRGLPVVRRAEMLAELMRLQRTSRSPARMARRRRRRWSRRCWMPAGRSDGDQRRRHPRLWLERAAGAGDWMVVEADESDGSFNRLPRPSPSSPTSTPSIWSTGATSTRCAGFGASSQGIPFYGLAVCCTDHPEVQALVGRSPTAAW